MKAGLIKVTPDPVKIGPNSIDLCLGNSLKRYAPVSYEGRYMEHQGPSDLRGRVSVVDPVNGGRYYALDPKSPPKLLDVPKLKIHHVPGHHKHVGKWLLVPGEFYLGVTKEETYCRGVVPHLDGRSTCGRLSIEAHKTAGVGDNGFRGKWTLEIEVTEPVIIAPGDRLFQIYFTPAWGEGMALAIQAMLEGNPVGIDENLFVSGGGLMPDGEVRDYGALLELHDLYGKDGSGHHYQGSKKVRGPSPLD